MITLKTAALAALLVFAAIATGCAGRQGQHIRFATATEAQLSASDSGPVWFEFRQGDDVPLAFLFTGVVEAATPVRAKAARPFWLVVEKGRPPGFSFDGEHVVEQNAGMTAIGFMRQNGANTVGVAVYLGNPEDAPPELKKMQ